MGKSRNGVVVKMTDEQIEAQKQLLRENPDIVLSQLVRAFVGELCEANGIEWPENMPSRGGWQGEPKEDKNDDNS